MSDADDYDPNEGENQEAGKMPVELVSIDKSPSIPDLKAYLS